MLSLDTATTVFGEITKYVWNFVRNRWVRKIVTKTSTAWPPMHMLRKGNVENWYNHQHDTIVITAFLLCHNTQQKDTQFLNVFCVHKTQQKVLNSVSYDTSLDVFLFHSTICTKFCCKNLVTDFFTADDYLELVELCLILDRKTFLSKDQKSRKQVMQVKYFCLKQGSYNYPEAPSSQNAAATAKYFFCMSL